MVNKLIHIAFELNKRENEGVCSLTLSSLSFIQTDNLIESVLLFMTRIAYFI